MYGKIFEQIYDSSISENYETRHIFMDLVVLGYPDGVVDMTHEAIARRINVPIEIVKKQIAALSEPDPKSRSKKDDGRRLVPLDPERDWGWRIVNYSVYREIRDEEARKKYFREKQRKYRRSKKLSSDKDGSDTTFNKVERMVDSYSYSNSSSNSKKEKEKRDPKREKEKPNAARPRSETEVVEYCLSLGLTRSDAEYFWNRWQANGYVNAGKSIKDWRALIRSWKAAGYCPSQKAATTSKPNRKPTPSELEQTEADRWYEKNYGKETEV